MRMIPLTVENRAGHEDKKEVARYPPKPKPMILSVSFLPMTLSWPLSEPNLNSNLSTIALI